MMMMDGQRQQSMGAESNDGLDGVNPNARMSARAKSKINYVGIHNGTFNDANKGFPAKGTPVG